MIKISFSVIIIFSFVFYSNIFADNSRPDIRYLPNVPAIQAARAFEQTGNYFESLTEHYRARHESQSEDEKFIITWRMAQLYADTGNAFAGIKAFEEAQNYNKTKDIAFELHYLQTLAGVQNNRAARKLNELTNHPDVLLNKKLRQDFQFETSRWLFQQKLYRSAGALLTSLEEQRAAGHDYQILYAALKNPPRPDSPWNLLYAVVPGGLFYRYGEFHRGSLSFFTVGFLGFSAAWAYSGAAPVIGTIALAFALRYYIDSIMQSMVFLQERYAQKENQFIETTLLATGGEVDFRRVHRVRLEFPVFN